MESQAAAVPGAEYAGPSNFDNLVSLAARWKRLRMSFEAMYEP
jgi:hypothetical protein